MRKCMWRLAESSSGFQIGTESTANPARRARLRPRGSHGKGTSLSSTWISARAAQDGNAVAAVREQQGPLLAPALRPQQARAHRRGDREAPEGRVVSPSKRSLRACQRIAALGTMLATLGACNFEVPPTGPKMEHPNGLRLTLPEGYRATSAPQGFVVEPQGGNSGRRFPSP